VVHTGVDKVAQVCHIEAPADNVGNGMLVCEDMPKVNTYIKRPGDIETARIDDLIPPELAARIGVLFAAFLVCKCRLMTFPMYRKEIRS
jgi:hypothetical protein